MGIRELLGRFPSAFSPQLGYILSTLSKSLVDSDENVRKHYRAVVEKVLHLLGQETTTSDSSETSEERRPIRDQTSARLIPFAERLGFQLRSALTHRDVSVREDALSFIELLIDHHSINQSLLQLIVQACIKGSSSVALLRMDDLPEMIFSFIDDLYSRTLVSKFGHRHFSQVLRITRIGLQLLPAPLPSGPQQNSSPSFHISSSNQLTMDTIMIPFSKSPTQNHRSALQQPHAASFQTSQSASISDAPADSPVSRLLCTLIDLWSQLSAHLDHQQPIPNQRRISAFNESLLRQITSDHGLDGRDGSLLSFNHRISLTPSDENTLIPLAARLDVLKLILRCLIYLASPDTAHLHHHSPSTSTGGRGLSQVSRSVNMNSR